MSLLFIQHIETHWTKESRGGAGAQLRGRVPERFALPSVAAGPAEGLRVVRQEWMALERESFAPTAQVSVRDHARGAPVKMRLCEVRLTGESVEVTYHYHGSLGAPRRSEVSRRVGVLGDGQWALITANGRWSHEDRWTYVRHVMHVGFFLKGVFPGDLRMPPEVPQIRHRDEHALW